MKFIKELTFTIRSKELGSAVPLPIDFLSKNL